MALKYSQDSTGSTSNRPVEFALLCFAPSEELDDVIPLRRHGLLHETLAVRCRLHLQCLCAMFINVTGEEDNSQLLHFQLRRNLNKKNFGRNGFLPAPTCRQGHLAAALCPARRENVYKVAKQWQRPSRNIKESHQVSKCLLETYVLSHLLHLPREDTHHITSSLLV